MMPVCSILVLKKKVTASTAAISLIIDKTDYQLRALPKTNNEMEYFFFNKALGLFVISNRLNITDFTEVISAIVGNLIDALKYML